MYHRTFRMPQLSEKARALYVVAYGAERYERYSDTHTTPHGASPPYFDDRAHTYTPPEFYHRPEHDVESIYWSMVSALLHVRPTAVEAEPEAPKVFMEAWEDLLKHRIPDPDEGYCDPRANFLSKKPAEWSKLLLGDLKSLGPLLEDISRQVRPEYALCGDGLLPDHLHEAVQRLILQYLVDYNDTPIPLDPNRLRPIPKLQRSIVA
ncbi:hypothetical protein GSI_09050 [Ganoderma sinense ZZ0214-1]|uniref:Uncharacterized protein n=1 Tax=Ganoderma sinense ZZ0214-1 TaxID=1077348 RepID=A0A2G8S5E9_9APHY|nr:hypothetical protein GSI_09050 [Ganoderma sinense ZZ0214-1]